MSKPLCLCATQCEWRPEHYNLEHHPDCAVNAPSAQARLKDVPAGQTLAHVPFGDLPHRQSSEPILFPPSSPSNFGAMPGNDPNACRYPPAFQQHPPLGGVLDGGYLPNSFPEHTSCSSNALVLNRVIDGVVEEAEPCLITTEICGPFIPMLEVWLNGQKFEGRCEAVDLNRGELHVLTGRWKNSLVFKADGGKEVITGRVELRVKPEYEVGLQQRGFTPVSLIEHLKELARV